MDLAAILHFDDLPAWMVDVEAELVAAAAAAPPKLAVACERQIHAGGKRLRPALMLAIATAFGDTDRARSIRSAAALELVHTGSLIHDDIIDKAAQRRGAPTINAVEGGDLAIIGGDLLLGIAGQLATSVSQGVGQALSQAIVSLCIGQTEEMLAMKDPQRTRESYETSIYGKTAALIEAACLIGAQCADLDADAVDAFGRYGRDFGMAFQIIDDVLDVLADEEKWGKPVGADLRAGVLTLPMILAREAGDGAVATSVGAAWSDSSGPAHGAALDALRESPHLDEALDVAREHVVAAEAALAPFDANERIVAIRTLPSWYLARQLQEMT